jgi:hypothetical protein
MSYEQWTTILCVVAGGAVISFVVVGLMTYFISRRPPDEGGKRMGRPWAALLAGVISFFVVAIGGSAAFLNPYPEHHARYEREHEAANRRVEREGGTDRANFAACMNACPDAPSRCGVFNVERCEERQSQMRACVERCDDRYGPN